MQGQDQQVKQQTVACKTPKEMKAIVRPEFQKNFEKYYPVEIFKKMGFHRTQCKCGHFYWRKSEKSINCGDPNCVGKYTFIGSTRGIGKQGTKLTYVQAWNTFKKSLTSARIPCTAIDRYPVVARWRNDVDYVAAGIFCFQPFCVTGELDPPANPLICPQFCLRFNDLDNIGLTGRHYSGFVMLGIQVFNKPDNYLFFKQQCVQFNYRWLTEQLKLDPEQITFVEDIWAGGGNLGPSIEYFVGGLEIGNMVFMQYKYFNDGGFEQLNVKVIDVGIGLERIPWLINGTATSYHSVFTSSLQFLNKKLEIPLHNEIWQKLGPYTSRLDVDESQDLQKTWKQISQLIGQQENKVKQSILPVKQIFVILDHTRTALMIISDGGLPSNTGGGSNCRNIIRRIFSILKKNGWWQKIGELDGLIQLFQCHKKDLSLLYGQFSQYKSFRDIIKIQLERWQSTQSAQKKKLQQLIAKNKGTLNLDSWIMAIQSWGISADVISNLCKCEIPYNLYHQIAERALKVAKKQEMVLYDTIHYPQTISLYYQDHKLYRFDAKIVGIFNNVEDKKLGKNIILLNRSAFYPTSGGQVNDLGTMKIKQKVYNVINVQKVGKSFLHYMNEQFDENFIGQQVHGVVDEQRRNTLRCFHTGTHIMFAAARRVLGPHIWQNGAKKTIQHAHLDITHYSSLTKQIEMQIENEANRIILEGHPIRKYFELKSEAEKQFGFRLYQGGIVPGNMIRIVNIDQVDVQACCGTHADNTSEVGWVKLIKSARISDGILRLYYVAGKKVMNALNQQTHIINDLKDLWGVNQLEIIPTAKRIFNDYKKFEKEAQSQKLSLLNMHSKYISQSPRQLFVIPSLEKQLTLYFSSMNTHLVPVLDANKTLLFINDQFIFGIISKGQHLDLEKLKAILKEDLKQDETPQIVDKKFIVKKGVQYGKGKDKVKKDNVLQLNFVGKVKEKKIIQFLTELKFQLLK